MSVPRILLVDDHHDILKLLHSTLDTLQHKFEISEAPSGEEALLEASRNKIDLLVVDYRLPGITGVELMRKIRARYPDVRVIIVTGMTDREARDEILEAGVDAVFDKPISLTDFLDAVERSLGLGRTIMPEEDGVDSGQHQTISNLLANFRQDIDAQAVYLLSDRGRVLAAAGSLKDNSMEASLFSSLMAIYSAGQKVSRYMHQKELNNYHVFSGGDHDLMLIPVNAAYAMLLAGNELATQKKVLGTVRSMLAVRDEVKKALKQMGVAPVISDTDNFEQKTPEFTGPVSKDSSDEIDTLIKKKMKKVSTGELEAYWDDAALKQKNVPTNPDVITYDQARKLGLNPGEAE
ncbi:MAG: response regulator [Anaerolineae bacterium]|nr:response regulator [Anaerolineae bacterium]MDK1081539.1 response regulator [Anaerolineae bacterium]MDK1119132.1 response regulator [Anaerolineae bacterium]